MAPGVEDGIREKIETKFVMGLAALLATASGAASVSSLATESTKNWRQ
jgi:hypothetical protein